MVEASWLDLFRWIGVFVIGEVVWVGTHFLASYSLYDSLNSKLSFSFSFFPVLL